MAEQKTLEPQSETSQQLGMNAEEWNLLVQRFGRAPNDLETTIVASMWSEEISNKSSSSLLNRLFRGVEPPQRIGGTKVAALRLPTSQYLVFGTEENNQQLELNGMEAARTALSKALMPLAACGAEPLAILPLVRIGPPEDADHQRLLRELVEGLSTFANRSGIPIAAHNLRFHPRYRESPFLDCVALGLVDADKLPVQPDSPPQSVLLYFGVDTRRDGLKDAPAQDIEGLQLKAKPRLIFSDPLVVSRLISAAHEAAQAGLLTDSVTTAAGGLAGAIFRLAARLNLGLKVDLDRVPIMQEKMPVRDLLLADSRERMLVTVTKERYPKLLSVFEKWGFRGTAIGEVIESEAVKLFWNRNLSAEIPLFFTRDSAIKRNFQLVKYPPMLKKRTATQLIKFRDKQSRKRAALDDEMLRLSQEMTASAEEDRPLPEPDSLEDIWVDLLADPNLCSHKLISDQFDRRLGGKIAPINSDASVIKLPGTNHGIGISFISDSLYVGEEPYLGSVQTAAEAMRQLAACGAKPLAAAVALNFGDPARYRELCDLAESVRALGDALELWNLPILNDTISLFNGSEALPAAPTPALAMIGWVEDVRKCVGQSFKDRGDEILLVGATLNELRCTEYAYYCHHRVNADVPEINFDLEKKASDFVRLLIAHGLLESAASIGIGGLATALTACAISREQPTGAKLQLEATLARDEYRADAMLFSETSGRFLVTCKPENVERLRSLSFKAGVPITGSGQVGGRSLIMQGAATCEVPLPTAVRVWLRSLDYIFV